MELCRPSDTWLERLEAAYQGKLAVYAPLLTALSSYTEGGWTIQILPWVVGARGLIQTSHMCTALEVLEVPYGKRQPVIDSTVQASIVALAFMNNTRFAGRTTGPIPTSLSSKVDFRELDILGKRKRRSQDGHGNL